jgi:uncharacterized membrane protein YfcA
MDTPPRADIPDEEVEREHAELGLPPVEEELAHPGKSPVMQIVSYLVVAFLVVLAGYFLYVLFVDHHERSGSQILSDTFHDPMFWSAVGVGFLAQVIDGALGMAYGITSSSFLLAAGASPVMASGATHLAEVFTTGISGVSHLRMGNVNKKLFLSLLIPGVCGGLIGTYVLSSIDGSLLKPWISGYLLLMGLYVLSKAFRRVILVKTDVSPARVAPLALFGSFMDTTGGGGWGPIVTTSLVGAGHDPRTTIGSVNFAEFFLTCTVSAAFFSILDGSVWLTVGGLVLGGMFAAPFAAYITRHIKTRFLLVMVGVLISAISAYNLYSAFAH